MTQQSKNNILDWFKIKSISEAIKVGGMLYFIFQAGGWYQKGFDTFNKICDDIVEIKQYQILQKNDIKNLTSAVDQKCDSMNNYNYYKTYWEQNYLYATDAKKKNYYNRN